MKATTSSIACLLQFFAEAHVSGAGQKKEDDGADK
jgi:hypothetical protein